MASTLADFIDQRLVMMLDKPVFWGGAEAFELQVLLLLEIEFALDAPQPSQQSLRWILDHYHAFLRTQHPNASPQPLSATVNDPVLIAATLQMFREYLRGCYASPVETDRSGDHIKTAPMSLGVDVVIDARHSRMPRAA